VLRQWGGLVFGGGGREGRQAGVVLLRLARCAPDALWYTVLLCVVTAATAAIIYAKP